MTGPSAGATGTTGLAPNVAAALAYFLGFVTGIIFYMLERDNRFVRFHAMQSILVSVVFVALSIVISIFAVFPFVGWIIAVIGHLVLGLGAFLLWLVLMFKAFSGEEWEVPIIGAYARRYSEGPSAL